ncbi:MAG: response regulator [Labilibaculum sp.]|nr:response regulator [Labilibaculum sp.]MBI9059098.1 response regulator [Labilibaculum sp.]
MDKRMLNILSVEDSQQDFELLNELLLDNMERSVSMERVETKADLTESLKNKEFEIILCDFKLLGFDAFGALEVVQQINPNIPFICVSGSIGEETAIELLKKGAVDYVLKDRPDRLPFAVTRALSEVKTHNEKLEAEAELRESEQKFKDIFFKHSAIKMILNPTDLKIVEVNEAAEKFYGWSNAELKKMKLSEINRTWSEEEIRQQFSFVNSTNKFNYEVIHHKKDGSIVEVDVFASKLEIKGKTYLHIIVYDISVRKLAQKQVKLLSRAVEQSSVSVMITDPNGNIEYINPYFTKTTGYNAKEVIGLNPRFLGSGHQPKHFYKDLWDTVLSGKDWVGEFKNKKKNNETYWESAIISSIVDEKNEISHFIAIKEDITERKNMVKELMISKEKAEESDRLKSAFLANMSHEIRTPMNGILGFTSLLLEPDLSDEKKDEFIKIIHLSGERMLNTVTDIVEISKIEAGIIEVKNSTFNISESSNNILNFFQPQAQKKGLILSLESEIPETNHSINSDKNKFESIFTNLIKNAIKYTDKGKIIVNIHFRSRFIEFCIKDTGIGIPENRKDAIFNRFEQADISDTRAFEGSGLGLAIVKSYVDMLGGKIWVESVEGEGSQFYFSIPYSPEKKESILNSAIKNRKELNLLGQLKILIVEDDETSALFLKTILKNFVQKIIYAKTGEQAIEECKSHVDFDLILMDIKMPGMSGYEATRQIRQFNKEVIIIAQTAFGLSGDKEKAINAGCNDYITKPINREELNILIQKYFKI